MLLLTLSKGEVKREFEKLSKSKVLLDTKNIIIGIATEMRCSNKKTLKMNKQILKINKCEYSILTNFKYNKAFISFCFIIF